MQPEQSPASRTPFSSRSCADTTSQPCHTIFCYRTTATTTREEASSMRLRHGPTSSNKLQGVLPLLLMATLLCYFCISPVEAVRPAITGSNGASTCTNIPDETTTECRNRSGCALCLITDDVPRHARTCICCKPGRIPNPNNTAACIPVSNEPIAINVTTIQ
jgi:hypothetical protein